MRFLIVVLTCVVWLCSCIQLPVQNEDEVFECDLTKDGKFLFCHDRKRTETAHK
jgi:hypothetical protein